MGFGLLFLGHLFLADFPYQGIDVFPDAAGFALMILGLLTLRRYEKKFVPPLAATVPLLAGNAAALVFQLSRFFGVSLPGFCFGLFPVLLDVGEAVYLILLFLAIAKIASDTGLTAKRNRAFVSVALTGLLLLSALFFSIDAPFVGSIAEKLNEAVYYANAVYLLTWFKFLWNASLLFSCYMRICDEKDVDMEPRPKKNKKSS